MSCTKLVDSHYTTVGQLEDYLSGGKVYFGHGSHLPDFEIVGRCKDCREGQGGDLEVSGIVVGNLAGLDYCSLNLQKYSGSINCSSTASCLLNLIFIQKLRIIFNKIIKWE